MSKWNVKFPMFVEQSRDLTYMGMISQGKKVQEKIKDVLSFVHLRTLVIVRPTHNLLTTTPSHTKKFLVFGTQTKTTQTI
ncbi:17743_t:CDS:2 [Acaulospora morrowiae]|uniref:17743_t:CDS:1 n=1 Tax=Acaulospora morrowiae TaxID=94023 RepID=A0A9N9AKN0_9GLOM|nr:17743_t:CDS:2 [Acaulospora morrowiae]